MQRELLYRCSSGSGKAMANSTGCSSVEDVGQQGQASAQVPVPDDQGDVQWSSVTRAHSSLIGSVDLGILIRPSSQYFQHLRIPRKDKEADTGKRGESQGESMPNVEGTMDPIDPPPHEHSSSKRRPSWLRETLEDVENHIAPRGTFRETYEPSSPDVPPLSIPSTSDNISSSDGVSEDENPAPPSRDPPSAPQLPKWVRATRDAAGALAGDPTDQHRTRSQFDGASSLLAQASVNYDPDTFAEALGHPDWETTMNEEYCSLLTNDTWDLVPLPKRQKLIRCKWVYRTKFGPDGKVGKHKARLVAKGFSQVEGIDCIETFSPVAKMNSIRLVFTLAASFKWEVHQMDVKFAFLHGDLHEEIYMEQPPSFI
eukprot:PITA_10353